METYERKRPRGRPARRWRDELDDYWKGTIWQRIAQDRQMWTQHREAFAQWLHSDDDDYDYDILCHIVCVCMCVIRCKILFWFGQDLLLCMIDTCRRSRDHSMWP